MTLRNIFETITQDGDDDRFEPAADSAFLATDAPPGSLEKLEIMMRRVELGQPIWHPADRCNYSGLELLLNTHRPTNNDEDT